MSNSAKVRKQAKQLKGRPVCITLHDGSSYMGWITGIHKEGLTLSGQHKNRKPNKKSNRKSPSYSQKATISGLMPLFGSLLGNAGAGGFGGFIGMMQKAVPLMQMGYKMIKTIMPLMGGLKGLLA